MPKAITPYQLLLKEIVKEIEQHQIRAAQELNTTMKWQKTKRSNLFLLCLL
jgi:hypothetical protein